MNGLSRSLSLKAMPEPDLPADTDDKDPQFAYTLARGLQVLRAFEGNSNGLGNREIAGIVGIPRSTVARLTRTLGMLGYLHYDAPTTRYSLTTAMLTLAYPLLAQLPVRQVARPHMQELANDALGSVSLAMRDGLQLVLIESCVGPRAVTRPDIGAMRGMGDTAVGMAWLVAQADVQRAALVDELMELLPKSAASVNRLWKTTLQVEMQRYASRGFCLSRNELAGTLAVGAPVRLNGNMTMSMNCVVASHRVTEKRMTQDIGPRLVRLARDLEQMMGYQVPCPTSIGT